MIFPPQRVLCSLVLHTDPTIVGQRPKLPDGLADGLQTHMPKSLLKLVWSVLVIPGFFPGCCQSLGIQLYGL